MPVKQEDWRKRKLLSTCEQDREISKAVEENSLPCQANQNLLNRKR
jgi:hypothetical protein